MVFNNCLELNSIIYKIFLNGNWLNEEGSVVILFNMFYKNIFKFKCWYYINIEFEKLLLYWKYLNEYVRKIWLIYKIYIYDIMMVYDY